MPIMSPMAKDMTPMMQKTTIDLPETCCGFDDDDAVVVVVVEDDGFILNLVFDIYNFK